MNLESWTMGEEQAWGKTEVAIQVLQEKCTIDELKEVRQWMNF
jgi:hypothetical protein